MKLVFLTTSMDDEYRILADREKILDICEKCESWKDCKGADILDGCGCLTAFVKACELEVKFEYERNLKK